jgi:5-formyltetrahydrofolate cyclo-ligase
MAATSEVGRSSKTLMIQANSWQPVADPIRTHKTALRQAVKARLGAIKEAEKQAASKAAVMLLEQQQPWKQAATILFYAPLPGEVDIWTLFEDSLRAGKRVFLPRHRDAGYSACEVKSPAEELRLGRFGIREPIDTCAEIGLNRLDFVLVPGIAFDLNGRRLGRGKGYYDQLLTDVRGKICGVAFDEQIVPEIPVEPHDILVNCILTPTRWIEL